MTEPQFEAAVVESLKGAISKDGKLALIKAVRPGASQSGADDINLAIPVQMLPRLLGLVLHLVETADAKLPSPKPGMTRRRCFDSAAVELREIEDGRQALQFELVMGGKIAIAVDNGQAEKISNALSRHLDSKTAPADRKLH